MFLSPKLAYIVWLENSHRILRLEDVVLKVGLDQWLSQEYPTQASFVDGIAMLAARVQPFSDSFNPKCKKSENHSESLFILKRTALHTFHSESD